MSRPSQAVLAARVVALLVVAGVVAGVLWALLVDPPLVTRDTVGLVTDGQELGRRIDADAWFAVLAVAFALPCGLAVAWWRRLDPVVGVVAVVGGAALASLVCRVVGGLLGPGSPVAVLTDAEVGTQAPDLLQTHTWVVYALWPLAAAFGALVTLLLRPAPSAPVGPAPEGARVSEPMYPDPARNAPS